MEQSALNLPHFTTKVTSWSVILEFGPWERKGEKLGRKRLGEEMSFQPTMADTVLDYTYVQRT